MHTTHPEACGTNPSGMRFVMRGAAFLWVHPAEMLASDVDCSDMSDAEFEAQVLAVS